MSFLRNKNILIVDDDRALRVLARNVLEGSGATVFEARSVPEALEKAQSYVPHLIVIDLKMPEQTGFDFLEKRRSLPALSSIPVVVLSALIDRAAVHRAVSLGASDYVAKPIVASVLLRKVRKALKDRTFDVVNYEKDNVTVRVTLQGTITMANEVGFMVEVPAKISEGTKVDIASPLLKQLQIERCVFKRTERVARSHEAGLYLNEVSVIGLDPEVAKKISKTVRGWI